MNLKLPIGKKNRHIYRKFN